MSAHDIVLPEGWPRPSGYSNAIVARGSLVAVAGQVGWNPETMVFEGTQFVEQVRATLANVVTVLRAARAGPEHVIRMTWYITDKKEYLARLPEIGEVYRSVMGRHFPAMTMVQVVALIEDRAKVEIEATAVLP